MIKCHYVIFRGTYDDPWPSLKVTAPGTANGSVAADCKTKGIQSYCQTRLSVGWWTWALWLSDSYYEWLQNDKTATHTPALRQWHSPSCSHQTACAASPRLSGGFKMQHSVRDLSTTQRFPSLTQTGRHTATQMECDRACTFFPAPIDPLNISRCHLRPANPGVSFEWEIFFWG